MTTTTALTRRGLFKGIGAGTAGLLLASLGGGATMQAAAARGDYTLPPLVYPFAALEPNIDAMTMMIHHDRHHQTFVDNLNTTFRTNEQLYDRTPEALIGDLMSLPESIRTTIRNNGGGHVNHTIYWDIMTPGGAKEPQGSLAQYINTFFGSYDAMKMQVTMAATTRFGSGWGWLSFTPERRLIVESTANQDNPLMEGRVPLLGVDVWEHAYYLKYQNRRADYLTAWWNTVNWDRVGARWTAASGLA